jgi:hypothetical protein
MMRLYPYRKVRNVSVKKIVKKVLEGTVSLPAKYSELIENAVLGRRPKSTIKASGAVTDG